MIFGLVGKNASGKGSVAEILKRKGFHYDSLSDAIREELRGRGTAVTRETLIEMGNRLRKELGPGVLAERVYGRLDHNRNHVVDSFRNPAEVEVFRRRKDFCLIHVTAPDRVRFERIRARAREADPLTFEEFLRIEAAENSSSETRQRLDDTLALADVTVENSSTLEDLGREVSRIVAREMAARAGCVARPGWDAYFMGIARVVASRSNCLKRKVAAVIVKDRRIISTGYNGTPRGTRNCNEGGCPRCSSGADSGTQLEECVCCHGEENAIVQAAYHGVSVKDAAIYVTCAPCLQCTKMIINSGISQVYYHLDYPLSATSLALLKEAGVQLHRVELEGDRPCP